MKIFIYHFLKPVRDTFFRQQRITDNDLERPPAVPLPRPEVIIVCAQDLYLGKQFDTRQYADFPNAPSQNGNLELLPLGMVVQVKRHHPVHLKIVFILPQANPPLHVIRRGRRRRTVGRGLVEAA